MQEDAEYLRDLVAVDILEEIAEAAKAVNAEIRTFLKRISEKIFDPKFDVNALWDNLGVNRASASQRFSQAVGKSPGVYIRGLRMKVAAELLERTHLKICQIADVVAYGSGPDSFTKAFVRWSGLTPREYRKQHSAQDRRLSTTLKIKQLADQICAASENENWTLALGDLAQVEEVLLEEQIAGNAADLALSCHQRGTLLTRAGKLDRAYGDLEMAHHSYGFAELLPRAVSEQRERLPVPSDTKEALLSRLCSECRAKLMGVTGGSLRECLERALLPVPRDLPWFEASCGNCCREIGKAISRARLGLMENAWKAWWISTYADLKNLKLPPSRGRIILALSEVENGVFGDQLERKALCDLAVADAVVLGDAQLETQARIWRGAALRGLGELAEAREELLETEEASRASVWLSALWSAMMGVLECYSDNYDQAIVLLQSATDLYSQLDSQIAGRLQVQLGGVHFFRGRYEDSIAANRDALSLLDARSDLVFSAGVIPINLATSLALLGCYDDAERELSQCRFDREEHRGLAATELFTQACLKLLQDQPEEALPIFDKARVCFEELHRLLDVALTASYIVEAYSRAGDQTGAFENATAALSFFQAAGCSGKSIEMLGQLEDLLECQAIDVQKVVAIIRSAARENGGWLPDSASS